VLFDIFAKHGWYTIRPDAHRFSALLPDIGADVRDVVQCAPLEASVAEVLDQKTAEWRERTEEITLWRRIRERFAALADEEEAAYRGRVFAMDSCLSARVECSSERSKSNRWTLKGPSERIRARFETEAAHAATALNVPDTDPITFWLDRLLAHLIAKKSGCLGTGYD